jgi:putative flippase GtrA
MNTILRWLKFNLVGALGMMVQLAALAVFHRAMPGHDSLAVAAAVELTLLHNLVWHLRYTWLDRSGQMSWLRQCLRFHLSNGLVSLAGNLVLMRLLAQGTHVPLLVANAMAILCCSVANFWLGNCWAFGSRDAGVPQAAQNQVLALRGRMTSFRGGRSVA